MRIEEALTQNDIEKVWNLASEIDVTCDTDAEVDELCQHVFQLALELGSEDGLQTLIACPVISSRRLRLVFINISTISYYYFYYNNVDVISIYRFLQISF